MSQADYVIYTDSACDISPALLAEWGVKCVSMRFEFDGDGQDANGAQISVGEFYRRMRAGGVAKTAAINLEGFRAAFEEELQAGRDILYVAFSSGLSNTCDTGRMAARELEERYSRRSVRVVDSLCASAGEGLLVWHGVQQKQAGASLEEAAAYLEGIRLQICHWFTVEDLVYLKRGGRVSATAALAGSLLGIKPMLHVDDEGHLIPMFKVRGRKASIQALADQYAKLARKAGEGTVFLSHGDCPDDAHQLERLLWEAHGIRVAVTADIGPVIGAHSGPGTLALFFLGKER